MSRRFRIVNELAERFFGTTSEDEIEVEVLYSDYDSAIRAILEVLAECRASSIRQVKEIIEEKYGCCIGENVIKNTITVLRTNKLLTSENPLCLSAHPSEIDIGFIKSKI